VNWAPRAKNQSPFWIPGLSYYFLSFAVALTLFFLIWAVLIETGESTPFIPAGMLASLFLVAAFVVREVLIKRARNRQLEAQRQLDLNLDGISPVRVQPRLKKLTIVENRNLLTQIFEKSEAAGVLKHLPEAHWEVFDLCERYLAKTRREIARTHINSPRFGPISKGRGKVKKLHKHHLMRWAKEQAGLLSIDSKAVRMSYADRIDQAESARECLSIALGYYPREKNLRESHEALKEYVSSIKISQKMDQASRAALRGNHQHAVRLYRDVLHQLTREYLRDREKEAIAEKVKSEIQKLNGS